MTSIRNDLSQFIRKVDGGNELTPYQLGAQIEAFLGGWELDPLTVVRFVERINADKTMSAGQLADEIVDEFELDAED